MSRVEVFLDETPGETRGMIARNGQYEHILIHRDDDAPGLRLGARSVGRVVRIEPGIRAAFIDLGVAEIFGFLPLSGQVRLTEGARIEVEVTAEPRDGKGPALKLIGPSPAEPGLVTEGPDVRAWLEALAPGTVPVTGSEAIQASWAAEEDALSTGALLTDFGLDLHLQRTRALVAADLDWAPSGGAGGQAARDRANARGLEETARLIGLKSWGGLVAVDLIGVGLRGDAVAASARRAFADQPRLVLGPVNRFGVLMLSLPWRWTPVDQRLADASLAGSLRLRAQAAVRKLNFALLSDRSVSAFRLKCSPEEAALAQPWVTRIGPRARLVADPAHRPGEAVVEEA